MPDYVIGQVDTEIGPVPRVAAGMDRSDRLGALRVRWGFWRMKYLVEPGLYAVGSPTPDSPVMVSANYKLSFDYLRKELDGIDTWILVLDTRGVNVWCAAGKGTFGTDEIVNRVDVTDLGKVVAHRTLIVPQLGAPGVAAHEVRKRSGFRVAYGPVRARDIPAFLEADMQATAEMRRVRFDMADRLAVVPVEIVMWGRYALPVLLALFVLAGLNRQGYDFSFISQGRPALLLLIAFIGGAFAVPLLLPWLPGRALSVKGVSMGLLLVLVLALVGLIPAADVGNRLELGAWLLVMPAGAAFLAMNYTGSTTYTSLSGVRKEMRVAVPAEIGAAAIGLGLWIAALFF